MVLKGQDDGEGRGLEGTLRYRLDHLLKRERERKREASDPQRAFQNLLKSITGEARVIREGGEFLAATEK